MEGDMALRVISGKARGLKLNTPKNDDVRPTTDRVKESLFNIINPYIMDSDILDLFAWYMDTVNLILPWSLVPVNRDNSFSNWKRYLILE